MLTVYALNIPADTDEEYTVTTTPLNAAQIAEHLGNDYRLVETNAAGVQFYEATTGDLNTRAAALCQLDDAATGTFPITRRLNGSVLITGDDGNGNPDTIPTEKLRAYGFYLDFTH